MDWDLFTTEGRVRRTHYLLQLVVIAVAPIVATAVVRLVAGTIAVGVVSGLLLIAQAAAYWCVSVRRAHDAGRSASFVAWAAILQFVGILLVATAALQTIVMDPSAVLTGMAGGLVFTISAVMTFALLLLPPDGDNAWGPDPR